MDTEQPKMVETGGWVLSCTGKCVDMLKGEDWALASKFGTSLLSQDCANPSQDAVAFLCHTREL